MSLWASGWAFLLGLIHLLAVDFVVHKIQTNSKMSDVGARFRRASNSSEFVPKVSNILLLLGSLSLASSMHRKYIKIIHRDFLLF